MKRKNLLFAAAAAAVFGVFNPAFAGGNSQSSAEESMTAPPVSEQSASPSIDSSTDADVTAGANIGADSSVSESESLEAVPADDATQEQLSQAPAVDIDPRTGLDEAHPAN